jgi:hypothetical protein
MVRSSSRTLSPVRCSIRGSQVLSYGAAQYQGNRNHDKAFRLQSCDGPALNAFAVPFADRMPDFNRGWGNVTYAELRILTSAEGLDSQVSITKPGCSVVSDL